MVTSFQLNAENGEAVYTDVLDALSGNDFRNDMSISTLQCTKN
jgi:hypothetical protein